MTWDNFFTAEVGAAAALAGLVFVGISINLQRILALPMVVNRAFQALLILLAILAVESILLVPGLNGDDSGASVLAVGALLLVSINLFELQSWRIADRGRVAPPQFRRILAQHSVEIQLPPAMILLGGLFLVAGNSWALYWFLPATLLSFLLAIVEAWVITIEILR
jgi:hypothetical protein